MEKYFGAKYTPGVTYLTGEKETIEIVIQQKKDEGGGAELDLIHEVNYAQYLFEGKITDIYSNLTKISDLKISSNDLAFFAIRQQGRFLTITLNYFQLFPERYIKLLGSAGTLFADLINKKVEVFNKKNKKIYSKRFDFDYSQMYIDEVNSMIEFIKGSEKVRKILSMEQAVNDLKLVEGII